MVDRTMLAVGWIVTLPCTQGFDFADNSYRRCSIETTCLNPTILLFLPAGLGGQATINADGYLEGPPDLVAEVAASSASIDMNR